MDEALRFTYVNPFELMDFVWRTSFAHMTFLLNLLKLNGATLFIHANSSLGILI